MLSNKLLVHWMNRNKQKLYFSTAVKADETPPETQALMKSKVNVVFLSYQKTSKEICCPYGSPGMSFITNLLLKLTDNCIDIYDARSVQFI